MFESSRSYTTTKTAKMRKTDDTGLGDADSVDFGVNRMLLKWTPITLFGSKPLRFVAFQRLISNCVAGGDSWESLGQQGDQTSQSEREWILNIHWKFSSVQSLSRVLLFATPWTAACQASLSITNSQSLPKLMSIELVMPFNHLILCHPLLLLPPTPPSIRVFSNESALRMRWPKYWSFSFSISLSNEHPGLICFKMDWLDLLAV